MAIANAHQDRDGIVVYEPESSEDFAVLIRQVRIFALRTSVGEDMVSPVSESHYRIALSLLEQAEEHASIAGCLDVAARAENTRGAR